MATYTHNICTHKCGQLYLYITVYNVKLTNTWKSHGSNPKYSHRYSNSRWHQWYILVWVSDICIISINNDKIKYIWISVCIKLMSTMCWVQKLTPKRSCPRFYLKHLLPCRTLCSETNASMWAKIGWNDQLISQPRNGKGPSVII